MSATLAAELRPNVGWDRMNDGALILAIGDVHLGTSCSGLPHGISDWGLNRADLTPGAALRLAVDFAIKQEVQAVLFAGDVVESTNARFEAMLPLEESVRRLLDAGIEVVAVAGNHDVEALPRLAALIDGFTLLGKGGQWETLTLAKGETPFAQVIGWSFGEKFVRQSPIALLLNDPLPPPSTPVPRIGLLHCDLGASGGYYAPVRQAELDNTGYDAWLLGHIHKPSYERLTAVDDVRPSGYLGSLVGLDPSETGPHGPWLLEVSGEGGIELEQIPLAPVRWEPVRVSMDGIEHVEDVPDRLLAGAQAHVHALARDGLAARALGLRVQLTGASTAYDDIRKWIEAGEWTSLVRRVDDTVIFFNRIVDAMQLHLDVQTIASGDDPAGLLARRLLLLGQDDNQSSALLERARERLAEIARQDDWKPIQEHRNATDPLSDAALRALLLRSGKAALNAMIANRQLRERS